MVTSSSLLFAVSLLFPWTGVFGSLCSFNSSSGGLDGSCPEACSGWRSGGGCCSEEQFTCTSLQCIPKEKVCNHDADCPDKSDEMICYVGSCSDRSCANGCAYNNAGNLHYCTCPKGYINHPIMINKCDDIDECETKLRYKCSQICLNNKGHFNCMCHEGYTSSSETVGKCVADNREVYLLYAELHEIHALNIDTGEKVFVVSTDSKVTSIDYDQGDMIYWVHNYMTIYRSYMVGALNGRVTHGSQQLVYHNSYRHRHKIITSIAVDWLAGNLYWAIDFYKDGYIMVSKADGRYPKRVVSGQLNPLHLTVNPRTGWMYWVNFYEHTIKMAHMDGGQVTENRLSDARPIEPPIRPAFTRYVLPSGGRVRMMFVDRLSDDLIYWNNANGSLWAGLLEKKNNFIKLKDNITGIYGDIFEDVVYWLTEPRTSEGSEVMTYDRFTNVTTYIKDMKPTAIRVFQAHRLPNNRGFLDQCIDGSCPYLCLHTPSGFNCSCPSSGCSEYQDPVRAPPPVCSCSKGNGCYWMTDECFEDDASTHNHLEANHLVYVLVVVSIFVAFGIALSFFKRNR